MVVGKVFSVFICIFFLVWFCSAQDASNSTVTEDGGDGPYPSVGEIRLFASKLDADDNFFIPCDGRCLSIDLYPTLYQAIRETYGSTATGDFCVPNFNNKTFYAESSTENIGNQRGQNFYLLDTMISHSHSLVGFANPGDTETPEAFFFSGDFPRVDDTSNNFELTANESMVANNEYTNSDSTQEFIDLRQPYTEMMFYIAYKGGDSCNCGVSSQLIITGAQMKNDATCMIFSPNTVLLGDNSDCVNGCGSDHIILQDDNFPKHTHDIMGSKNAALSNEPLGNVVAVVSKDLHVYSSVSDDPIPYENYVNYFGSNAPNISVEMESIGVVVFSPTTFNAPCTFNYTYKLGEIKLLTQKIDAPEWYYCDGTIIDSNLLNTSICSEFKGSHTNRLAINDTHCYAPNLIGRVPVGASSYESVGTTGGNETFLLTENHIPPHNHGFNFSSNALSGPPGVALGMDNNRNLFQSAVNLAAMDPSSLTSHGFDSPRPINITQKSQTVYYYMYIGSTQPVQVNQTFTNTPTQHITPTITITVTVTDPPNTPFSTISIFPTSVTSSLSTTVSVTSSSTASVSGTTTTTPSGTPSQTSSPTSSQTSSPTVSPTVSPTSSPTVSPSLSPSLSASLSPSGSQTASITPTPSQTSSESLSNSIQIFNLLPPEANSVIQSSSATKSKSSSSTPIGISRSRSTEQEMIYWSEESTNRETVPIIDDNGELIGTVSNNIITEGTILIISQGKNDNEITNQLSPVIDISLYDTNSENYITSFKTDVEICLKSNNDKNPQCLSYFDENKNSWECEDPCLDDIGDNNWKCGTTNHFTSFALLLQGDGNGDSCDGNSKFPTLFWVSMACIMYCILFVIFGIIMIEIRFQIKKYKTKHEFVRIETAMSTRSA